MNASATTRIKIHEGIATLFFGSAGKRGALDLETLGALENALDQLHVHPEAHAIVLTGDGPDFSAGIDLKMLGNIASQLPEESMPQWANCWQSLERLLQKLLQFPKPVIAAVDGQCLGGGFGLALACDLIVSTPQAQWGVPAAHHGLVAGGVAPLLAFRIGAAKASGLLLTGEIVAATTLEACGLIHRLVPSEQIWIAAQALAQQCAQAPGESIQMTKRILNETIGENLQMQMSVATAMAATICTTESAQEGLQAFAEKRPPNWP